MAKRAKPQTPLPPTAPGPTLTLVVAEHLHAGFGVGVVGWLKAQLGDAWLEDKAGDPDILPRPSAPTCPGLPAHLAW